MKAIEIYAKINEIVEKEDPVDASIAVEFVQRDIQSRRYEKDAAMAKSCMNDQDERAMSLVRKAVRAEMEAGTQGL